MAGLAKVGVEVDEGREEEELLALGGADDAGGLGADAGALGAACLAALADV